MGKPRVHGLSLGNRHSLGKLQGVRDLNPIHPRYPMGATSMQNAATKAHAAQLLAGSGVSFPTQSGGFIFVTLGALIAAAGSAIASGLASAAGAAALGAAGAAGTYGMTKLLDNMGGKGTVLAGTKMTGGSNVMRPHAKSAIDQLKLSMRDFTHTQLKQLQKATDVLNAAPQHAKRVIAGIQPIIRRALAAKLKKHGIIAGGGLKLAGSSKVFQNHMVQHLGL